MAAALVLAISLTASTMAPMAPLKSVTMFRAQSIPFGPVDRIGVEIVPKPGYHFFARDAGAAEDATTIGWAGGQGVEVKPLPDPRPRRINDAGIEASVYIGPTIFLARLRGSSHGTAIASLHLAVCGNACFPLDYVVDKPIGTLPVRHPWMHWAIILVLGAAGGIGAGATRPWCQIWLTRLTKLRPASS